MPDYPPEQLAVKGAVLDGLGDVGDLDVGVTAHVGAGVRQEAKLTDGRAPIAIVVVGGLLVFSMLTLVVIPMLYSLFDDWYGGRGRSR